MIEARHLFLLRNAEACFESCEPYFCKACAARGNTVAVSRHEQAAHLAAHRREKVLRPQRVRDVTLEDVAA